MLNQGILFKDGNGELKVAEGHMKDYKATMYIYQSLYNLTHKINSFSETQKERLLSKITENIPETNSIKKVYGKFKEKIASKEDPLEKNKKDVCKGVFKSSLTLITLTTFGVCAPVVSTVGLAIFMSQIAEIASIAALQQYQKVTGNDLPTKDNDVDPMYRNVGKELLVAVSPEYSKKIEEINSKFKIDYSAGKDKINDIFESTGFRKEIDVLNSW